MLQKLIDKLHTDGGFTHSFNHYDEPTDGFMVSLAGMELQTPLESITPEILAEYVLKPEHCAKLMETGCYLGAWVHNGKVFLDVSVNITDKAEALKFAKDQDQLAIWDIVNQKEIGV